MSKAKCSWTSVKFGDTPIEKVTNGSFCQGGKLLRFELSRELFPSMVCNINNSPSAAFTTADVGTIAKIGLDSSDTLIATLQDEAGEVDFTMLNAVFENVDMAAGHSQYATGTGTWQSFSKDGITNPLSFALGITWPKYPDALMMPENKRCGVTMVERVASIAKVAEPLLHVDRTQGDRAYIRLQAEGKLFVTKSIRDTIFFPAGHEKGGLPRYRWRMGADGIEHGYLTEPAP